MLSTFFSTYLLHPPQLHSIHGGGMEDNDDDYFSDDFDSLPPGTLHELEQNAFQATQAPASQAHAHAHGQPVLNDRARPGPLVRNPATLKPPPRLHTGLTNDYDTLEVGELEAEVHDNVEGPSALPRDHHALVAESGWPVNGGMGDVMELDEDYGRANAHEINARLEQVSSTCAVLLSR